MIADAPNPLDFLDDLAPAERAVFLAYLDELQRLQEEAMGRPPRLTMEDRRKSFLPEWNPK
jgi:hypothetical protein